jgi:integrase
VFRFVRRAAYAAGLPAADRITPHSFRHAWATVARERGASLEERQYALGHADPRTTQRYDRARASLDRDPSYLVASAVEDQAPGSLPGPRSPER